MDELYQAEWCPHSHRVRQRLTELGVSFVARPVPADPVDREEMRRKTGTDEIPALLLEDGTAITGGADAIIEQLDARFSERADAGVHRDRANDADGARAW
jgi:glutathione S-transferase